jgi:hypothetical protein
MTTTTPAAISSGCAGDNGPAQNADPTGFRILPSRLGRSFLPVRDRHGRLTEGFDSAAYDGHCAIPRDRASRE